MSRGGLRTPAAPGPDGAALREANESLVLAAVEAHTRRDAAEQAAARVAETARQETLQLESRQLETLAVLAGGVAHDFNNLLTAIMGNADLGCLAVQEREDPTPYLQAITKAALRAADLTRQLLAYAGKGKYLTTEVDLNMLVHELVQIGSPARPARVDLQCDLGEPLPQVSGDATQLFQVIMNLVTNAVEACPQDRDARVTVRTRAERLDPADLAASTWVLATAVGPCATLEVTDTGSGIRPEILGRIFEPFFSTKFTGRGLGLAALMGVLRGQGGGLQVRSRPGHGSSFKLFLPALPAPAGPCPPEFVAP